MPDLAAAPIFAAVSLAEAAASLADCIFFCRPLVCKKYSSSKTPRERLTIDGEKCPASSAYKLLGELDTWRSRGGAAAMWMPPTEGYWCKTSGRRLNRKATDDGLRTVASGEILRWQSLRGELQLALPPTCVLFLVDCRWMPEAKEWRKLHPTVKSLATCGQRCTCELVNFWVWTEHLDTERPSDPTLFTSDRTAWFSN